MTPIQVGLIDKTGKIDVALVQQAALSLNTQATRDLPQYWPISATVHYLHNARKLPVGIWPIYLVATLPAGEGGFHLDKHNQPYAKVLAEPGSDGWTVAASHELCEMLVDPYGNRVQSSRSIEIVGGKIQDGDSEFDYLVEACDPCEADNYAYTISGIGVSDFITPHFYDPVTTPSARYSFTGAITAPRQILPGGYISWVDHSTERWGQLQYIDPNAPPKIVDLGPASAKSIREWVHTREAAINGIMRSISTESNQDPPLKSARARRANLEAMAARRGSAHEGAT